MAQKKKLNGILARREGTSRSINHVTPRRAVTSIVFQVFKQQHTMADNANMAAGGGGGEMTLDEARAALLVAAQRGEKKKMEELKALIARLAPPSVGKAKGKGKSTAERRAEEEARKRVEAEKETRVMAVLEAVEEAEEVLEVEGLEEAAAEVIEAGKSGMVEETKAALKRLRELRGAAASAANVAALKAAKEAKEAEKKRKEECKHKLARYMRNRMDEYELMMDERRHAYAQLRWEEDENTNLHQNMAIAAAKIGLKGDEAKAFVKLGVSFDGEVDIALARLAKR
jgi:hypothetical protein